jgi:hypothetical protein
MRADLTTFLTLSRVSAKIEINQGQKEDTAELIVAIIFAHAHRRSVQDQAPSFVVVVPVNLSY